MLYVAIIVLRDFKEPLNIFTNLQYVERVVLHIETAEFLPDDTELTLLFFQLQNTISNMNHTIYITHIQYYTGLPGPLAHSSTEINQLLIRNVVGASEFL